MRTWPGFGPMKHIVLLGDSVFDNAAYVGPQEPDVRRQLQDHLGPGALATLMARDGSVLADIPAQLRTLPRDATHIVISAGGNDALAVSGVLDERVASVAAALERLATEADHFSRKYFEMLQNALMHTRSTAVCTIYEPRYPDPNRRRIAAAALSLLNDRITKQAFAARVTLIDLRLICDQDDDFANPIEPSVKGGDKIASALAAFVKGTASAKVIAAS
jgi:lysophospholipase L1-like esterase